MFEWNNYISRNWKTFLLFFLSNMFLIISGLLPDSLQGENVFRNIMYIIVTENAILYNSIGLIFMMISISIVIYRLRKYFLPIKTLSRGKITPHKCLIAPISKINEKLVISDNSIDLNGYKYERKEGKSKIEMTNFINFIENLINEKKIGYWSWQQMLRGVNVHYDSIEKVILIGSKNVESYGNEIKGSYEQINNAVNLINFFFEQKIAEKHCKEVDFEDDNDLRKEITLIVNKMKNEYNEQDIVIDVTGGMKPTSIAGAIVTLNTRVTFQYVQTIGQKDVIGYDVIISNLD